MTVITYVTRMKIQNLMAICSLQQQIAQRLKQGNQKTYELLCKGKKCQL